MNVEIKTKGKFGEGESIDFCKALGFEPAGKTEPMWIYAGDSH